MKIGLSLSFCIADIVSGKVKEADVEKIITSTSFRSDAEFKQVLDEYSKVYWVRFPDKAREISRRLYEAGKLEQPRIAGKPYPDISEGHWRDA